MYAKLFAQMYDGTLATKGPWEALVTFQQMLVLSDKDGHVDMTAETIARRTTIPLEIIVKGIQVLMEPDPESRSPKDEGRRIVLLSENRAWGWRIVNYPEYRRLMRQEDRKEYMRVYMREYRDENKGEKNDTVNGKPVNQTLAQLANSMHMHIDSRDIKNKTPTRARARKTTLPEGFGLSERVIEWAKVRGYGRLNEHLEHFRVTCAANGYTYADWDAALMRAIKDNWAKLEASGPRRSSLN